LIGSGIVLSPRGQIFSLPELWCCGWQCNAKTISLSKKQCVGQTDSISH